MPEVIRALALTAAAVAAIALGGCSGQDDPSKDAKATNVPKAVAKAPAMAGPPVESKYGTPVKDRVATIGLLNKRNNLTQDLVMKSGEARRYGNVVVRVATCERSLPWESPPETGAFVQVFVEERANAKDALAWRTVFSGWLFKNSPSLNVVEHPVYDVWVKDCAMKFPGEEEAPAAAESASSAAKPAGSASAAPAPKPSVKPSPTPSPRPSPTPDIGLPENSPTTR
jgi:hypothetical protein